MQKEKFISLISDSLRAYLEDLKKHGYAFLPKPENNISLQDGGKSVSMSSILKQNINKEKKLSLLQEKLINCQMCGLCSARKNIVFGCGNSNADLVFVGEAPGAKEDQEGLPFVGRAGALLTKMIQAISMKREDVYICNVVKCRPPENRNPQESEINACEPFLKAQLAILKPKVIVTLGKYATSCLLRSEVPISALRGKWTKYQGVDLMPTYHPAYLLRNASKKADVWQDLQNIKRFLDE